MTYFTVIHLDCHEKGVANAIEAQRKETEDNVIRRSNDEVEWEFATKNNIAKCNNFFPIRSRQPLNDALRTYMAKSEHMCRSKVTPFWLILNDMRSLMVKFAKVEDLARESGAGRFMHNIKLIPF